MRIANRSSDIGFGQRDAGKAGSGPQDPAERGDALLEDAAVHDQAGAGGRDVGASWLLWGSGQ